MTTLKIKLAALSLTLLVAATTFSATADSNKIITPTSTDQSYFKDYFDRENFTKELNLNLVPQMNVMIYDLNGELLMAGDKDSVNIRTIIRISDLMTEVNGTSYYRMSYQK
jgi:hypothetical protein